MRDELRQHVNNLRDHQLWGNRAMFERVLEALDAEVGAAAVA